MTEHTTGGPGNGGDGVAKIAATLAADGYRLDVERGEGDQLRFVVSAGPDACADCLVPRAIMTSMLAAAAGVPEEGVSVVYPEGEG